MLKIFNKAIDRIHSELLFINILTATALIAVVKCCPGYSSSNSEDAELTKKASLSW